MTPITTWLRRSLILVGLLVLMTGCSARQTVVPKAPDPATPATTGTLKFLESFPEETVLNDPDFPEAYLVWPQVLGTARKSIDVASFYFSRMGDGQDAQGPDGVVDRLVTSTRALATAANHGVEVRVLGDAKFQKNYPEVLAWIDGLDGAQSRVLNAGPLWGGVLHAKYFLVDDETLYVGSQNWDWRSMNQIRELGVLITEPALGRQLKSIFEMDWALAGSPTASQGKTTPLPEAVSLAQMPRTWLSTPDGQTVNAVLAASPGQALPAGVPWDLPLLVQLIDSARETVHLQLLSYGVTDRERRYFADLDNALRRAAARKVKVSILLANWSKSRYKLSWIQSLAAVYNIEVKFSNIPENSKGFIPFARVEHSKYLIADGQAAWVGTANWSRDYFYSSRNISLFLDGAAAGQALEQYFALGWNSPYTEVVDPSGHYEPPKRH